MNIKYIEILARILNKGMNRPGKDQLKVSGATTKQGTNDEDCLDVLPGVDPGFAHRLPGPGN